MIRIFVSSTFEDMHKERDLLHKIELKLNKSFEKINEKIRFVDLRWGISTSNLPEEKIYEKILKNCFQHIRQSDLFLLFIGDRYGNEREYKEIVNILGESVAKKIYKDDLKKQSITELEYKYAKLINKFNEESFIVFSKVDVNNCNEHIASFYNEAREYTKSFLHYSTDNENQLEETIYNVVCKKIESLIELRKTAETDCNLIKNIALDSVVNTDLVKRDFSEKVVVFTDSLIIGKTAFACSAIDRIISKENDAVCFAFWGKENNIINTETVAERIEKYQKNNKGQKIILLFDNFEFFQNFNLNKIISYYKPYKIFITTRKQSPQLNHLPVGVAYKELSRNDLVFDKEKIPSIIENNFKTYDKELSANLINILSEKEDICYPLYLHFLIRLMSNFKESDYRDFNKITFDEGFEKFLREIGGRTEFVMEELIRRICDESGFGEYFRAVFALIKYSHKGIPAEEIVKYLTYAFNVSSKDAELIANEIIINFVDFIVADNNNFYLKYPFGANGITQKDMPINMKKYASVRKREFTNEYIVCEYLYSSAPKKAAEYIASRKIWGNGLDNIRKFYNDMLWELCAESPAFSECILHNYLYPVIDLYYEENFSVHHTSRNNIIKLIFNNVERNNLNNLSIGVVNVITNLIFVMFFEQHVAYNAAELVCLDYFPKQLLTIINKADMFMERFFTGVINFKNNGREEYYYTLTEAVSEIFNSILFNCLSSHAFVYEDKTEHIFCKSTAAFSLIFSLFSSYDYITGKSKEAPFLDYEFNLFNIDLINTTTFYNAVYFVLYGALADYCDNEKNRKKKERYIKYGIEHILRCLSCDSLNSIMPAVKKSYICSYSEKLRILGLCVYLILKNVHLFVDKDGKPDPTYEKTVLMYSSLKADKQKYTNMSYEDYELQKRLDLFIADAFFEILTDLLENAEVYTRQSHEFFITRHLIVNCTEDTLDSVEILKENKNNFGEIIIDIITKEIQTTNI